MAAIKKIVSDRRFSKFRDRARLTDSEALGCLLLFWAESRDAKQTSGDSGSVYKWLPSTSQDEERVLGALKTAGYVSVCSPDVLSIVDNLPAQMEYERRAAIGAAGGKASAAKRAKKGRRKAAPKAASTALQRADASTTPSHSVQAWNAYAATYQQRYGAPPVSNATVRGQMAAIVKRIGERAIDVMPFYVAHNDSFYVLKHHPVGIALKDCESLATQCATHRPVTSQDVRGAEKEYGYAKQLEDIRAGKFL